MYLTHITHDFNFTENADMQEILHKLEFKQSKLTPWFPFFQSKISFHSNQGKKTYLLWSTPMHSSIRKYTFVVEDVVKFYWMQGSGTIKYKYLKHTNDTLVHYWLLHTFLPLYFTLEDTYQMLHVGAVDIHGKACLFAAPSFGGKSTLTQYFLQKGHPLLSDDKLALFKQDNVYFAAPSYPYVRQYRKLEDLGTYVENFAKNALPVDRMYRLKPIGSDENVSIQEVKGMDKFSIVEMSYAIKLSMLQQKSFLYLHDMAQKLTIYEIGIPQNLNRLDEVYEKIMTHNDT